MSRQTGRNIALSPFRKLVIELSHQCQKVPGATVERTMNLSPLIAARQACTPRPTWTGVFLKAMGIVAAEQPALHCAFMPFPWPYLYEHPINIANFTIERRFRDEDVVFFVQVRSPERRSFANRHDHPHLPGRAGRIGEIFQAGDPHEQGAMAVSAFNLVGQPESFRQIALPQLRHVQPDDDWVGRRGGAFVAAAADRHLALRHVRRARPFANAHHLRSSGDRRQQRRPPPRSARRSAANADLARNARQSAAAHWPLESIAIAARLGLLFLRATHPSDFAGPFRPPFARLACRAQAAPR